MGVKINGHLFHMSMPEMTSVSSVNTWNDFFFHLSMPEMTSIFSVNTWHDICFICQYLTWHLLHMSWLEMTSVSSVNTWNDICFISSSRLLIWFSLSEDNKTQLFYQVVFLLVFHLDLPGRLLLLFRWLFLWLGCVLQRIFQLSLLFLYMEHKQILKSPIIITLMLRLIKNKIIFTNYGWQSISWMGSEV